MGQYAVIADAIISVSILVLVIVAGALVVYWRRRPRQQMGSAPELVVIDNSRYKPGQIWSLREGPQARLLILRVEEIPGHARIVHVAVSDVPIPVGHMPFAEEAIDRSVAELIRTDSVPADALDGYQDWRDAFNKGKAGVFNVPVQQAMEIVG